MRNVHIELDFAEPLPDVLGDANQLQQVFLNLMLNASQAMEGSGGLTIVTRFQDPEVLVTVEDTGIGIAEENLDRIFDPFFTTKPVGQGTGLGLSVTYGIVEQHGGTIEVESRVGMGTRFTIHLPVARLTAPGIAAADSGGENDPERTQT
jgi:signal transduction histidine kinase